MTFDIKRSAVVDTHRHLGGSTPVEFVMHAMRQGACQKLTRKEIEKRMLCLPKDPKTFKTFLRKFKLLDKINWTEELVADKIRFVCDNLNSEGLSGVFMDFSVSK